MRKIKQYILLLLIMMSGLLLKAQQNNSFAFELKSTIEYNSTMQNNYIYSYLLNEELISEAMKTKMLSGLENNELAFIDMDYQAKFYYHFDKLSLFDFVHFSYDYHQFYDIQFSSNTANLLLNGNAQWEKSNQSLYNNHFYQLAYHELAIGFDKKMEKYKFGVSLGFNIGENYQAYKWNNAQLNTEEDASSIELSGDFKYCRTDAENKGFGISTDIYFYTQKLRFTVDNLGYLKWDDNSTIYEENGGVIYFEGLDYSLNQLSSIESILDTLQNKYGMNPENKSFINMLPAHLCFEYDLIKEENKAFELMLGLDYYLFTSLYPRLKIKPAYRFDFNDNHLKIYAVLSSSMLKNYNLGLGLSLDMWKDYQLMIESSYFSSFVYPKAFSGMGIQARLIKKLYE